MQKKNKRIYTVISVLLCLPLILIAVLFIRYSEQERSTSAITSVRLGFPDGAVYELNEEECELYKDILLDSVSVEVMPEEVSGRTPIVLSYVYGDTTVDYDMYLSTETTKCFFVSSSLEVKSIPAEYAYTLMLDNRMNYLYSDYVIPSLTLKTGDSEREILPNKYSWKFQKVDGQLYSSLAKPFYVATKDRFTLVDDLPNMLSFSEQPDYIRISYMTESGTTIYESDKVEPISGDFEDDTNFNIHIAVKWYADDDSLTSGNAEYVIQVLYDIPESFTISSDTVSVGDYLIITASQLDVAQQVSCTTTLKNAVLHFSEHNGKVFSYLPIDCENITGVYDVILTVEGRDTKFTINVEGKNYGASFYNPEKELSENADAEVSDLYGAVNAKYESIPYFKDSEAFNLPLTGEESITYGKEIFYSTSPVAEKSDGIIFTVASGTKVRSSAAGRVVFAGETERYGKTVIIDHGLGIKSYYCHLKSISVLENVVVQKNIEIGRSGDTGYTTENMLFYAVSVNGVFIDPAAVLENGILLP